MTRQDSPEHANQQQGRSRRQFLGDALTAATAAPLLAGFAAEGLAQEAKPATPPRKIKLGLVGCGGRGSWIAGLFKQHGGYDLHAVADYFQHNADRCGDALGIDKARRFSGLSGYKKVIESGVEAVALIVPPCFLPEHSSAAAEAGLHVYMAKPVAVDVPGCLRVESAGKLATRKQRVFLVDYQIPTDPVNIRIVDRIHKGELGKLAKIVSIGVGSGRSDPPKTANIESRLQNLVWDNDIAIGGSFIVSYDIHAIDAVMWVLGQRPVAAMGSSRICRENPHGDSRDVCGVVYEYADGLFHEHSGLALPSGIHDELGCTVIGQKGHAMVNYWRKSRFERQGEQPTIADVVDLYPAGATRNIASFHQDVVAGRFENPTVRRAVDGCLTCILGREAGFRHGRLTMEEMLKENKRIEVDLSGLKA